MRYVSVTGYVFSLGHHSPDEWAAVIAHGLRRLGCSPEFVAHQVLRYEGAVPFEGAARVQSRAEAVK